MNIHYISKDQVEKDKKIAAIITNYRKTRHYEDCHLVHQEDIKYTPNLHSIEESPEQAYINFCTTICM